MGLGIGTKQGVVLWRRIHRRDTESENDEWCRWDEGGRTEGSYGDVVQNGTNPDRHISD